MGAEERAKVAEEGSRPALYNMRMGASQRKSTRMQNDERASCRSFSLPVPRFLASHMTGALVTLAAVTLACVMLYPQCANYYNETRQLQQLQAEYDALVSYNQQMQAQIDYLNTDEGVEDYARSELGWIRSDETVVAVEGVEPSNTADDSSNRAPYSVTDVSAPDTWYSGVLDFVFGYGK